MPRNGSGTSSVINTFVIDTIADPDEVNANFTDVADQLTNSLPRDGQAGMNAPLPLQNGSAATPALTFTSDTDTGIFRAGANKMGVALGGTALPFDAGILYAAKAGNYTALAIDNNSLLRFTAAATLSLTAAATLATNWHINVFADGGDVTVDPDGAETIDGLSTIIVPNGSSVEIICNGSAFFTNKALSNRQPFATIASAATTDLSTVGSQNVTVTGTTTITAFGTAPAGTFRRLVFSGILTLTHNATSLILPQGGNVVTVAGDSLEAVSLGSGNWRVTSYTQTGSQLVSGTAVALSGTSVDFTGIPSWVKQITLVIESLSTNGTAFPFFQIGDSGGVETSGYTGSTVSCANGNTVVGGTSASAFIVQSISAANQLSGVLTLSLLDAATNRWCASGQLVVNSSSTIIMTTGTKALSAALDRVRLTTSNGTDAFDGGTVNILYQ